MATTERAYFHGGMDITRAAQFLVELVAKGAEAAEGVFNDVTLRAEPGTTADEIVAKYHADFNAKAEAWRASPESQAAKAADAKRLSDAQMIADAGMLALPGLDLTDVGAVVNWLRCIAGPSDHVGVKIDRAYILTTLEAAGYRANENTGPAFREDDRENYARYLIGQAMDNLQSVGAIHGIFETFHDRWLAKFEPAALSSGDSQ